MEKERAMIRVNYTQKELLIKVLVEEMMERKQLGKA
jgi:hypothetical protein